MFRALAKRDDIDLKVFFCSGKGLHEYKDSEFGVQFKWDIPLVDGYKWKIMKNYGRQDIQSVFWGLVNPESASIVLSREYDFVLLHGWAHATSWLTWAATCFSNTRLLVRGDTNGLKKIDGVIGRLRYYLTRLFVSQADGCLAIGAWNSDFYRRLGADKKIYFVPFCVDNTVFRTQFTTLVRRKLELRRELGIDSGSSVILFCGKLIERKGADDLLTAFESLSRRLSTSLVFVGDGPLRTELKRKTTTRGIQRVHFVGFQNQSEIARYYAAADILVLPSESEPWGLTINEGMCFNLPIIASDRVGAARDLVREGVNGFTYPCGDVNVLAERIESLLRNTNTIRQFGEKSWEIIQQWGATESAEYLVHALDKINELHAD